MKSYKLALPSVECAWRRDRSLQALSGALSHQPLVWMLGLPGASKTTLAAQWVRQAQGAGAPASGTGWTKTMRTSPRCSTPCAKRPARRTCWPGRPPTAPSPSASPGSFAQWLEAHPSGLTLVLDDCHRLGAGSSFWRGGRGGGPGAQQRRALVALDAEPPGAAGAARARSRWQAGSRCLTSSA